jgi:UDP-N-acetylmuramoylalanine--D-glutamate ligase
MILGGFERMLPLEHFAQFVKAHQNEFRTLLLIGQSAERLGQVLRSEGFSNFTLDATSKTMPAIVVAARDLAQPGDAVVLSPGFASFDMFKNFEERGNLFRDTVNAL